eukprot:7165619-Pyramimonas_sp.AAC.1
MQVDGRSPAVDPTEVPKAPVSTGREQVKEAPAPSNLPTNEHDFSILYGNITEWVPQAHRRANSSPYSARCLMETRIAAASSRSNIEHDLDEDGWT